MPEADPSRTVRCIKLSEELPALAKAPFPNELGNEILEKVSKPAWDQWIEESVRLINTYRVDLGSKEGTEFMVSQLRIWLGLEEGELKPTAWTPPTEEEAEAEAEPNS
ncbi:MAG: oxidative damage protection protein [Myxococcota bacterium]